MNGMEGRGGKDERAKRRKLLHTELQTVLEQKAAVERQLTALRSGKGGQGEQFNGELGQGGGLTTAPSRTKGLKRPPPLPVAHAGEEATDLKRARIEAERAKRVASIWSQCSTIVKGLKKMKDCQPFILPVEPEKMGIPDYFRIINKPMDLSTILKKLENNPAKGIKRKYSTPYEFRDDVRLVWQNCRTYNHPTTTVRIMGDNTSDLWEKRWVQQAIEHKWEEEMRRQKAEELELAGKVNLAEGQIPDRMRELDTSLRELHAKVEGQARPKPLIEPPNRDMTFEEKRKLSQHLGQVPGDKLEPVLQIIAENAPVDDSEEEIELDIDSLDNETLWRLDKFVRSVLGLDKKGRGGGADAAPPGPPEPPSADMAEQETTSKPAHGGGGGAAAGPAGAPPPPASGPQAASDDSSSSGDSSSEGSGSDEEAGSRENVGSTFGDGRDPKNKRPAGGEGHDATTLVSATRPAAQAQILKSNAQRKEVTVQNASAWTALATDVKADEEEGGGDKGGAGDELWKEFQTRAEAEEKLAKEKAAEEERLRQKRNADAAAAREAAEAARREREAEAERAKAEAADRIAREKAAEKAALESLKATVDLTGQQAMMKQFDSIGAAAGGEGLAALGLAKAESEEEEEDSDAE